MGNSKNDGLDCKSMERSSKTEGIKKELKEYQSMKGRDVACAEQAGTGWDEENVDTDEMFEDVDSGRSHSQSDLARNALPIK